MVLGVFQYREESVHLSEEDSLSVNSAEYHTWFHESDVEECASSLWRFNGPLHCGGVLFTDGTDLAAQALKR